MKKITIQDLEKISKGSESSPRVTQTVPVSIAACPTTKCASVVKPCPGK